MIPACPAIVESLAQMAAGDPTCLPDVLAALERDPQLSTALLAAARSPIFDRASEANWVEDAIEDRGMDWLRSIVIVLLVERDLRGRSIDDFDSAWQALIGRALVIAHLAREFRVANVYEAYSYGVLRDCGEMIMLSRYREYRIAKARAERSGSFDLPTFERAVYGVDHASLSAVWAKRWKLPEAIWLTISLHHRRSDDLANQRDRGDITRRLVAIGALADVSDGMRRNPSANAYWRREQQFALDILGITERELNALNEQAEMMLTFP